MFKDKRHIIEFSVGIGLILAMILFGLLYNQEKAIANFGRILVGGLIGYALARSAFGFAGTVNRAARTGSTKLMKAVSILFLMGAFVTFIMVLGGFDVAKLSHSGITWGLLLGATLFGFGMALTVCCASGVLTDLAESPIKGVVALFFICLGGFLGKGITQASVVKEGLSWYQQPLLGIPGAEKGANFTDWFKYDGTNGALSALILTAFLVLVVWVLAHLFEIWMKKRNKYSGCGSEIAFEEEITKHVKSEKIHEEAFYKIFVKPWSLLQGAIVIAIAYAILMVAFKSTWGVSGPFGQWFARGLDLLGVPTESLMAFTGFGKSVFESKFFDNAMYIQDISIFLGALIAFLLSGKFTRNIKGWLFHPLEIVLYAVGGITVGIGFTIAGGCNAGGLFSPIVQFGVSGWIYLLCIIGGGYLGNLVRVQFERLYPMCCKKGAN